MAMCRAAGFARVELLHAGGLHAGVVCYRKWEPPPAHPRESPPELLSVANTRTFGINFSARREEYITCWFRTPRETVGRSLVCLEVDGLGAAALYTRRDAEGIWLANFRLPPGLAAGWQIVRLRFRESGFGAERRIAVDVPLHVDRIGLKGVCDGSTWAPGEVRLGGRACVTCWASGLPENADRSNVRGYLGDVRLAIEYLGETDAEGWRQINALVPADAAPGERMFRVECAGVSSESCRLRVV
jgi:hypothetical protein